MADNITAPAVGAILATDEIGGAHYPRSKVGFGVEGAYVDVSEDSPFPVAIVGGTGSGGLTDDELRAAPVPVTGAFYPGTQPVSAANLPLPTGAASEANQATAIAGLASILAKLSADPATQTTLAAVLTKLNASVAVTGTFFQATQPISAAALPLPAGASTETTLAAILAKLVAAPATAANQATEIAALATIGTRAYGTPAARVAVASATAYSAAITATEVLVHANTRCFILAVAGTGTPTVDNTAIPLEAGEKFHLRVTSGQRIGVIRDTADGFLNIVPVA